MRRPSTGPTPDARRSQPFAIFAAAGKKSMAPWVRLEHDLPELLSFFSFPHHLWQKLSTTNIIDCCFVEVRRRTRPMVWFVNVNRSIELSTPFSSALTWNGKPAPSSYLHKPRDITD